MSLNLDDVRRIARLARIEISAAEAEQTRDQLNGIFGLIEQMQAVDTAGIEPMAHAVRMWSSACARTPSPKPTAARLSRPSPRKSRPGCTWCPR